jgi:hypothetical protein
VTPGQADEEPEDEAFGAPLPPADRLWRHPSEVDEHGKPRGSARVGKLLQSLFSRPRA